MDNISTIFEANKEWVASKEDEYFSTSAEGQSPRYLWIGCADSRVPVNLVAGLDAGEVFVTRNIANLVAEDDLSVQGCIEYAVKYLGVTDILLCGHTKCGGVTATIQNQSLRHISDWLKPLQKVYKTYESQIKAFSDLETQVNTLSKLNVVEQVRNISTSAVIVDAWKKEQSVTLHGLMYDLETGKLSTITAPISNTESVTTICRKTIQKILTGIAK